MKIRTDFVTNSSSSSFIILCNKLTTSQMVSLLNFDIWFPIICKVNYESSDMDYWNIQKIDDKIIGYTPMDNNDDMRKYLKAVNIDPTLFEWTDD